jgi:putative nucleotidyltransferase with HDIG domain
MIFYALDNIEAGMITAAPVNVLNKEGGQKLLIDANTTLTSDNIVQLYRYKVDRVLVFTDEPPFSDGLAVTEGAEKIHPILDDSLKKEAVSSIRTLFHAVKDGSENKSNMTTAYQIVKEIDDIVDEIVDVVSLESAKGMVHISDLKSYDEYTYHHSLSVCVLSIAIGREMGFNVSEIKRLSRCAIMHDIGKVKIPFNLITKPSKLTDQEFSIVKQHPVKGVQYLRSENIGNEELWRGILHHHEKYDGRGYPVGLKGKNIPIFSRIIAVADVYDALTSYRSYRKPIVPPVAAMEIIMADAGQAFDFDVVSIFVKKVELYPLNSIIVLTNGAKGVVVNNKNAVRPKIKMLNTGNIIDLADINNLTLTIKWVEAPI